MIFPFGKKVFGILAMGLVSISFAADITPIRVGPVSQYGELMAGKNSQGHGRIYGSCKGVSSGNEVVVQGMSLFWGNAPGDQGQLYWSSSIVSGLVSEQNIQIIRAPMPVEVNWNGATHYFMNEYTESYQNQMDAVVSSAIENDIYVIIDFHGHCAEQNTSGAQSFFSTMAQKWGKYDNVIFEIYNEPKNNCSDAWFELSGAQNYWKDKIVPYAKSVISSIREYSDNLIVVGTPYFDQYPNAALAEPLNDKNVAYTFHYYAGDDAYPHTINNQGKNAEKTMEKGLSVFVTEWGNSAPSGNGGFNASSSAEWYNWMKEFQLSGANWAVSNKDETASYFSGGAWNYSTSGNWVNENVFAPIRNKVYTACSAAPSSSSSVESSSSEEVSSSSEASSSSEVSSSSVESSSSESESSSSAEPELSSSSVESSSSEEVSSSSEESSSSEVSSSSVESSSSELESSSSAEPELSSSSVESSSSEEPVVSSSSVGSSSSVVPVPSSSSASPVVSSSSEAVSSSSEVVPSSSSAAPAVTMVGELIQTNVQGGDFETVTFNDVVSYVRKSWNLHFLKMEQSGSQVTVSGSIPSYIQPGSYSEAIELNGEKFEIKLTVENTTVVMAPVSNSILLSVEGHMLHVGGAAWANVDVLDMQGRPVVGFKQVSGSVALDMLRHGNYVVRVRTGSNSLTRQISIK